MEKPRILDQEGREQDWSWLSTHFGAIRLQQVDAPEGTAWLYRIAELRENVGPAVQIVRVTDADGVPLEGVRVVRHWPDAPPLPQWPPPASRWQEKGVYGKTNAQGDIGFGMGRGDYYFPPSGGASAVWIADAAGPSDLIGGLGMLGGTNHRHLDVYYELQRVQEPVPPPTPPPQPGYYIVDQSGQPQDQKWLETYFGKVEHHRAPEPAAYRLVELRAVENSQEQKITVLDGRGEPQSGVPVSFRRRDGTAGYAQETGPDGTARFPLESDAKYPVPGQGPYLAVIKKEAGNSDAAIGLGQVLRTPRHLDVKFRLVRDELPPAPPPPPPPPPAEPISKEWQWLFDRLDRIIAILEERVG